MLTQPKTASQHTQNSACTLCPNCVLLSWLLVDYLITRQRSIVSRLSLLHEHSDNYPHKWGDIWGLAVRVTWAYSCSLHLFEPLLFWIKQAFDGIDYRNWNWEWHRNRFVVTQYKIYMEISEECLTQHMLYPFQQTICKYQHDNRTPDGDANFRHWNQRIS